MEDREKQIQILKLKKRKLELERKKLALSEQQEEKPPSTTELKSVAENARGEFGSARTTPAEKLPETTPEKMEMAKARAGEQVVEATQEALTTAESFGSRGSFGLTRKAGAAVTAADQAMTGDVSFKDAYANNIKEIEKTVAESPEAEKIGKSIFDLSFAFATGGAGAMASVPLFMRSMTAVKGVKTFIKGGQYAKGAAQLGKAASLATKGAAVESGIAGGAWGLKRIGDDLAEGKDITAEGAIKTLGTEVAADVLYAAGGRVVFGTLGKLYRGRERKAIERFKKQAREMEEPEVDKLMDQYDRLVRNTREGTGAGRVDEKAVKEVEVQLKRVVGKYQEAQKEASKALQTAEGDLTKTMGAAYEQKLDESMAQLQKSIETGDADEALKTLALVNDELGQAQYKVTRAYGERIEPIVEANTQAGTKISVKEELDEVINVINTKEMVDARGKIKFDKSVKPEMKKQVQGTYDTLKRLQEGKVNLDELPFKSANELKMLVGQLEDWNNRGPLADVYESLAQKLKSSDTTGLFAPLSQDFSESLPYVQKLSRTAGGTNQGALENAIKAGASDFAPAKNLKGNLYGELDELEAIANRSGLNLYSPEDIEKTRANMKAISTFNYRKQKGVKDIRAQMKKIRAMDDPEKQGEAVRKLYETYQVAHSPNAMIEAIEAPAFVKEAFNDPSNKELVGVVRKKIKKTMGDKAAKQFDTTMSSIQRSKRLRDLPSDNHKAAVRQIMEDTPEVAREIAIKMDLDEGFAKMIDLADGSDEFMEAFKNVEFRNLLNKAQKNSLGEVLAQGGIALFAGNAAARMLGVNRLMGALDGNTLALAVMYDQLRIGKNLKKAQKLAEGTTAMGSIYRRYIVPQAGAATTEMIQGDE